MSKQKPETLDESITKLYKETKILSIKTEIKMEELIPLMANWELILLNNRLYAIHERLNLIEGQKAKKKKKPKKKE